MIKNKVVLEKILWEINQINYYKDMDQIIYAIINLMKLQIINSNTNFMELKGNLRQ